MAVNKVDFGGNTLIDLTGDTLESAEQLLKGIIAHAKDGSQIEGMLEAGGLSYDTITFSEDYDSSNSIRTVLASISDNTAKIIMLVNERIFNNEIDETYALGVFLWYPGVASGNDIQGTRWKVSSGWFGTWSGTSTLLIVHAGDPFRRYTVYGN